MVVPPPDGVFTPSATFALPAAGQNVRDGGHPPSRAERLP
jgi:hypothetical protein